ncbi:hypothetical protein Ciccas_001471 [Cichlidogyrus casuarinus]|uniref:C2H2-type domain-containing protein n=1 Tax=Cichlidogyrus casuarinus TaxID=1844966 RepID=A0ABD2QL25_9PLAT
MWVTGIRYVCSQCNMVFDESIERDDHIRLTHDGGKIPNLDSSDGTGEGDSGSGQGSANSSLLMISNTCTICEESFDSYQTLDKHRREAHDSPPLYRCYTCSDRFTSRHILRMHRTGSHVIRSCPACKASFKRSIDLKRHFKRAHPLELPIDFPSLALDHNEEARQLATEQKLQAAAAANQQNVVRNNLPKVPPVSWLPGMMLAEGNTSVPKLDFSMILNKLAAVQPSTEENGQNSSLDYPSLANLMSLLLSVNQNQAPVTLNNIPASSALKNSNIFCPPVSSLPPPPLGLPPSFINPSFPAPALNSLAQPLVNKLSASSDSENQLVSIFLPKTAPMPSFDKLELQPITHKIKGTGRAAKGAVDYQNRGQFTGRSHFVDFLNRITEILLKKCKKRVRVSGSRRQD